MREIFIAPDECHKIKLPIYSHFKICEVHIPALVGMTINEKDDFIRGLRLRVMRECNGEMIEEEFLGYFLKSDMIRKGSDCILDVDYFIDSAERINNVYIELLRKESVSGSIVYSCDGAEHIGVVPNTSPKFIVRQLISLDTNTLEALLSLNNNGCDACVGLPMIELWQSIQKRLYSFMDGDRFPDAQRFVVANGIKISRPVVSNVPHSKLFKRMFGYTERKEIIVPLVSMEITAKEIAIHYIKELLKFRIENPDLFKTEEENEEHTHSTAKGN